VLPAPSSALDSPGNRRRTLRALPLLGAAFARDGGVSGFCTKN